MRLRMMIAIVAFGVCLVSSTWADGPGFTQEDRDRLGRLETALEIFMQQVDKRFEHIDKRFQELREDTSKRFQEMREDTDKRFQELREDMNKRLQELREDMNKRLQELREDMNKRLEQVDKRFEQIMTFLWILVAIFTTLTAAVIGFAYWDRRTIIRKAGDEAIAQIEREGRLKDLIQAMRALAAENPSVAEVLRRFHLL